jgi:DNA polymerase (family 10)
MTNADVAHVFNEVATLLELKGADEFRVTTYRRVARIIHDMSQDIVDVVGQGNLAKVRGIGTGTAQKVQELLSTGRLELREQLLREVPDSVMRLLAVPNIGPKKAALLWHECGVQSLDDLKHAIRSGALKDVKGFGPRTLTQMMRGIEFVERSSGLTRLGMAWKISTMFSGAVLAMKGIERAEFAGALRRGCEVVNGLDVLCAADDSIAIVKQFVRLPHVNQVIAAGDAGAVVVVDYEPIGSVRVKLRVVPGVSFGAAWLYYTGSTAHFDRLRKLARERGLLLNDHGLFRGEQLLAAVTEEEIYEALDLPWIPPELREDRGEFDLQEVPRDLIDLRHIRGDLHMHTVASDGRNTVLEMAEACRDKGYEYMCISEHSQSSAIAGGLKESVLHGHIKDVRAASEKFSDLNIWMGAEVDVLADGRMDYPDELMAELDYVTASVHTGMTDDIEKNTRRTLAAIRNPYVTSIGHPTGRLINEREAMPLDIHAICQEAARTGTALEINANNFRLDLKDVHVRIAREYGVTIVINTDAHAIDGLDQMRFGVLTGRRGWLRWHEVLNARRADGVRQFIQEKRARLASQT